MLTVAAIVGLLIILLVLLDAFETIVLPRKVQRSFRLTSWFYRNTWIPCSSTVPSPVAVAFSQAAQRTSYFKS